MSEFDPERLRQSMSAQAPDPKAWAWRLRKRELMLDRSLSIVQKTMWRAALRNELAAERQVEDVAA